MTSGSMNHFFSGIGRGTAFTRHGASGVPARFRPRIVPTIVSGNITNMQIHVTATCTHTIDGDRIYQHNDFYISLYNLITNHGSERYCSTGVIIHGDEIDEESSATDHERQHESAEEHLFNPDASAHPRV